MMMTPADLRSQLVELEVERATASTLGLTGIPAYREQLEREIAFVREAYVGAAVTEIVTLRAQLSGPLQG